MGAAAAAATQMTTPIPKMCALFCIAFGQNRHFRLRLIAQRPKTREPCDDNENFIQSCHSPVEGPQWANGNIDTRLFVQNKCSNIPPSERRNRCGRIKKVHFRSQSGIFTLLRVRSAGVDSNNNVGQTRILFLLS